MSSGSVRVKSFNISTPTWYPNTIAILGTVSTQNVLVTGIGTSFITNNQISAGDWLVNIATNEARIVKQIDSDTILEIESPFSGDPLTGITVSRIKDKSIKSLKIAFITNTGTVRGAAQALGTDAIWPVAIPWESPHFDNFLEPIFVTPGAGGATIIQGE